MNKSKIREAPDTNHPEMTACSVELYGNRSSLSRYYQRARGLRLAITDRLFAFLAPGRTGFFSRALDKAAEKRSLQSLIYRTNDISNVTWLGKNVWQYPTDAWLLQEMVCSLKPDVIIETGTFEGGSAFYLSTLCDLIGHGEVLSIDIDARGTIDHPRATYHSASSTAPETVQFVERFLADRGAKNVLIILDSDHSAPHVRHELELYARFIPVGGYFHVQDGVIDELACFADGGLGPTSAARDFLKERPEFIRDTEVEFKYGMTSHPFGWLRRTR